MLLGALKDFLGFKPRISREKAMASFTRRYESFRELLRSNTRLATIMANLDAALHGEKTMETNQIRKEARRAMFYAERMAVNLNEIASDAHRELLTAVKAIAQHVERELEIQTAGDVSQMTLSLNEVDASMAYYIGGKSANLGEMANMMELPVPPGFVITIKASSELILRNNGLLRDIHMLLRHIDPEDPKGIELASDEIQDRIEDAVVPESVQKALYTAFDATFGKRDVLCALRSSAIDEDGILSFAGQYRSILGVTRNTLVMSFKQVVASLFSPEALAYRSANGYPLITSGMGMCCLEMVRATAAGVVFSRHPVDLRSNDMVVNALWGLGEMVVDGGATPDQWLVSRNDASIGTRSIAHKPRMMRLECQGEGVLARIVDVPVEQQDIPCLTDAQIQAVSRMAMALEEHYQYPQDVEWAIDANDHVVLLQTRPMSLAAHDRERPDLGDLEPLYRGGDVAARGVAAGPVVAVPPDSVDMTHFPHGAVMLLLHSSPQAMTALRRAAAVIAETGSMTGHMASLCREFGVPTVMNFPDIFKQLKNGRIVTVDALGGNIYDGEVPELLAMKIEKAPAVANTPARQLLRRIAPSILPLHLVDPNAALFAPRSCTSLHDVMRYAHEYSYSAMFKLSDSLSEAAEGSAVQLVCRAPLDLHIIDLGGGLAARTYKYAKPSDVVGIPFARVLAGMLNDAVQAKGPRPVNMRGFLSVVGQSMAGANRRAGERFGDRSYAIISDKYLNFSSRVGYHYAILDTWCGDTLSKNYIRFEFAGGAAGSVQRERRVRCIGLILSELGFLVDIKGDRIQARFQKYARKVLENRLDQIGRLLIMTRQMDMLMVNEEAVAAFARKFMNGEYH